MSSRRTGLLQGSLAYALWGLVAAFWKLLAAVSPIELVAHRAVWGLVAFVAMTFAFGHGPVLRAALRDLRLVGVMLVSATLLATNWCIFVWATINGHLLDASLGYFINPLVSVALGTIVLGERLRRLQWVAIAVAATGVALLAFRVGHVPWIALTLAASFGLYGLVRKTARVEALVGSTIETLLMAPVALIYLASLGGGVALHGDEGTTALLIGSGLVTAVPLVLFTSATRLLPLSTIGFLQYLTPTGQFLLAVLAYGEPLAHDRVIAFVWIWVGLVVFSIDLVNAGRSQAR